MAVDDLDLPPAQRGHESSQAPPIEVALNHELLRRKPSLPEFVRQPAAAISRNDGTHRVPAVAERFRELKHHRLSARGSVGLNEQCDAQGRCVRHRSIIAPRERRTNWR